LLLLLLLSSKAAVDSTGGLLQQEALRMLHAMPRSNASGNSAVLWQSC